MGLHCRSNVDGSNASALRQLKATVPHSDTLAILETTLSTERSGRHELVLLYTVEVGSGLEQVREARGWVDQETCEAHFL
jgi:hypothetical protein